MADPGTLGVVATVFTCTSVIMYFASVVAIAYTALRNHFTEINSNDQ